jgi:aminopeptidase 2
MCKHTFGAEESGASIDISKGREILPTNVKPIHYHLTLEPNLETFEYHGTVVIE